ncbi:MAG: ABC transporter permease [Candidatus Promineifilaceae bacterium]
MRNIWIIARRELGAIFLQPIAYFFIIAVSLFIGFLFAGQLTSYVLQSQFGSSGPPPTVSDILSTFAFLAALFVGPAITMRLLSEEQKSGTMELLLTMPVRDWEVILGKFLAAFVFYGCILVLTLVYPFVLLRFGNPDPGPIFTSYIGMLLFGAATLAIGTLTSTLSENQIVSFILAAIIILVLYVSGFFSSLATSTPQLSTILDELSFSTHLSNFMTGLLTAKDILYYLLISAIALFAATRILESKRWR